MKILVTGAKGMLGTALTAALKRYDTTGLGKDALDITDKKAVEIAVEIYKPDVVINSAAFTKVDECESKADLAFLVNAEGPKNLALACKNRGMRLIHISTDYIFDGTKTAPYKEDDKVNPLSVYGRSKLAGEENIKALLDNHLIVRTQWLYGENGPDFVETIIRIAKDKDELRVVNDQQGCPTYTKDLALAVKILIEKGCRGTYHVANSGACTWYEFALEILKLKGLDKRVIPITTEDIARLAKRPLNSILSCEKLERDTGFVFRHWQEALGEYLQNRANPLSSAY